MGNARRKRGRLEATPAPAGPSLRTIITSWQLSLEAAGKSPGPSASNTDSVRALCAFLGQGLAGGLPAAVAAGHFKIAKHRA